MDHIDGISYFRAPWDYGSGGEEGRGGALIVEEDRLIVVARHRKKIGGVGTLVETAGGIVGELGLSAAHAARDAGRAPEEYRLEIPRASIRSISALPLGFGASYTVETTEGTDQLDIEPTGRAQVLRALERHGYPLSAPPGWQKMVGAAILALGMFGLFMLFRM